MPPQPQTSSAFTTPIFNNFHNFFVLLLPSIFLSNLSLYSNPTKPLQLAPATPLSPPSMDLPNYTDRQNNDDDEDDAPFIDALNELPFSDCAKSFSAELQLSQETSSPTVTLRRRHYAYGTFTYNESINSRSNSSVTSEVGSTIVTKEVFVAIKKVGNYRSLEENGDKSELTQNDELSTVTTASQVFPNDTVDSAAECNDDSL